MKNVMSLEGRTIIVTGGGQGIGLATSQLAVELGANVFLADIDPKTLEAAKSQLGPERCDGLAGSVSDEAFVQRMVERAVERFGDLDGLVNNAGITRPAMIEKMTKQEWQSVIDVNLTGVFLCTQAVSRHMLSRARAGKADPGVHGGEKLGHGASAFVLMRAA